MLSCLILLLQDETLVQEMKYLDNASQKLRIPLHFGKCKPLIRTPVLPKFLVSFKYVRLAPIFISVAYART